MYFFLFKLNLFLLQFLINDIKINNLITLLEFVTIQ